MTRLRCAAAQKKPPTLTRFNTKPLRPTDAPVMTFNRHLSVSPPPHVCTHRPNKATKNSQTHHRARTHTHTRDVVSPKKLISTSSRRQKIRKFATTAPRSTVCQNWPNRFRTRPPDDKVRVAAEKFAKLIQTHVDKRQNAPRKKNAAGR